MRFGALLQPFVVTVAIGLTMPGHAEATDAVVIATGHHPGYGRIAFRWPAPISFDVTRDGTEVVVHFDRALSGRFDRIPVDLGDYVATARLDDDGSTIRLKLKDAVEIKSFKDGPKVAVLDLMDSGGSAQSSPAALTKPEPAGAQKSGAERSAAVAKPVADQTGVDGPRVDVRLGEHKDYDRIVFDWPRNVGYAISRMGDRVVIAFSAPARVDLAYLGRKPSRFAKTVTTEISPSGTTVTLTLAPESGLRALRDGPRIVVDLLATAAQAKGAKDVAATAAEANAMAASFDAVMVKVIPPVEHSAATSPPPLMVSPTAAQNLKKAEQHRQAASILTGGALADAITVEYSASDTSATFRFPWYDGTALAAFRRADDVWLVFDRPAVLDLGQVPATGDGKNFSSIEQLPHLRGAVVRIKVKPGVTPALTKQDTTWTVELAQGLDRPATPIAVKPEPKSPIGPRVTMPMDNAAFPLDVVDPEGGDKLVVVPVSAPGLGIFQNRSYVDFRLLDSAQGIVVEPKADGIVVTARKDGVDVLGEPGLNLSAITELPSSGLVFGNGENAPSLFDFPAWCEVGIESPIGRKQELQTKLSEAVPLARNMIRLDLARFYFAEGLAPEALILVERIAKEQPDLADAVDVKVMRGALLALVRDFKSAKHVLDDPSLATVPEAALWRAAVAASMRDYGLAEQQFFLGGALIARYPHALQVHLGLLAAETLIARGDDVRASTLLDGYAKSDLTDAERGRVAYLRGRERLLAHRTAEAVSDFEEAEKGASPFDSARATLARVELLESTGKLSRAEAIDQLDKLRYKWRGDSFEFELLNDLAELYRADGNYRESLISFRRSLTYFPDQPGGKELAQSMAQIFSDLYVKGEAEKLSPLLAIAVYNEFKELSPTGPDGDTVAFHLADRLVAADLLINAEETLENLVKTRLDGQRKADAGTRLAKVYLLDAKPAQAIAALKESSVDDIAEPLVGERRRVEVEALIAEGKSQDALERLAGDASVGADRIRAELYWRSQQWLDATLVYERLATGWPRENVKLDVEQSDIALHWVIALTLLGNGDAVEVLRARFEPAFPDGPARNAFLVVTSDTGKSGDGFRKLATTVGQVDLFKSFMDGYRKEFLSRAKLESTIPAQSTS
ncbi:MAG TPA: tetratricopeptide repeat protein [Alphaproteobacteria bacterium]|nr:tetratricopeptide repeat protein [Alphaproteobacteria bacterium]